MYVGTVHDTIVEEECGRSIYLQELSLHALGKSLASTSNHGPAQAISWHRPFSGAGLCMAQAI